MTDFEDTRAALSSLFQTAWNNYVPTEWPNQPSRVDRTGTWARFNIQEGNRELADVGTRFTRTYGLVDIQIFCPIDAGTKILTDAAGVIAEALDHKKLQVTAELTIETYSTRMSPFRIEGAHYATNVSCSWKRDRIKAA